MAAPRAGTRPLDDWVEEYAAADELERRMVEAALACVARWGLAKTALDDIAREAGVSRATAYRVFPGGKDRWVATVIRHEIARLFADYDAEAKAAGSLEDLLVVGIGAAMRVLTEHAALGYMVRHEPAAVAPHFAFHRLERIFDLATDLSRPHLVRFLPDTRVRPAAELGVRVVLSYSFNPRGTVDPGDTTSIRRLVRTYLLPALTAEEPS